jgi:MerR family transcriptional regulator, thiopeptide resistance regulator
VRRIGEVAAATGLTVRTLHHYDEIGLLEPSERSDAGYRRYSDADVRRLYRIVAFRRLGFALPEIGALLDADGTPDPRALIRALDSTDGAAADLFLEAIEGMTMAERYYTPEQLAHLEQRRTELGEEGMRKAEADWAQLIAEAEELRASGAAATDPPVAPLADRWMALIRQFHGRRRRDPRLAQHHVRHRGARQGLARDGVAGADGVDAGGGRGAQPLTRP